MKLRGPISRKVNDPKHSTCGSARLADLDWSEWWTDGGEVDDAKRGKFHYLYVHVRRCDAFLDGGTTPDFETFHRVHPKLPSGKIRGIRLMKKRSGLYWLFDRPTK